MQARERTTKETGWIKPPSSTKTTFELLVLASEGQSAFKEAKEGGVFWKNRVNTGVGCSWRRQ